MPVKLEISSRRAFIFHIDGSADNNDGETSFRRSTEIVGLKIHPKTILANQRRSNRQSKATIDDIKVEVLPKSEKAKYFGQTITFEQQETTEIQSRIRAAWASFSRYRQELTSRYHLLRHRLRVFNMVITPTLTYGSGTWTLSQEHEKLIRSTQRKMLRLIVQTKRMYKTKNQKRKDDRESTSDKELAEDARS